MSILVRLVMLLAYGMATFCPQPAAHSSMRLPFKLKTATLTAAPRRRPIGRQRAVSSSRTPYTPELSPNRLGTGKTTGDTAMIGETAGAHVWRLSGRWLCESNAGLVARVTSAQFE